MGLQIHVTDPDCSYGEAIERFLSQEFPANLDDAGSVLDALTAAFVASGQVRQGPAPSPESLVVLRQKLQQFMDRQLPIDVVVPWGSRKPDDGSVDVAELFAIKQLLALDARVRAHWPAGTRIAVNAEDLGGAYLWPDMSQRVTDTYVGQLTALAALVSGGRVAVMTESSYTTRELFNAAADAVRPGLVDVLLAGVPFSREVALDRLKNVGWVGDLPDEQVGFYMRQYARHYPGQTYSEHLMQLARYYAQAYARYQTSARGPQAPAAVFVNFPQAVPGAPESLFRGRLFYRTLPTRFARTHIPPWRAKGYLEISEAGASPKLSGYHDIPSGLHEVAVDLHGDFGRVTVRADYLVTP